MSERDVREAREEADAMRRERDVAMQAFVTESVKHMKMQERMDGLLEQSKAEVATLKQDCKALTKKFELAECDKIDGNYIEVEYSYWLKLGDDAQRFRRFRLVRIIYCALDFVLFCFGRQDG
jgi:macrodomain Ter protein organizer (MatP/YcbG family)